MIAFLFPYAPTSAVLRVMAWRVVVVLFLAACCVAAGLGAAAIGGAVVGGVP